MRQYKDMHKDQNMATPLSIGDWVRVEKGIRGKIKTYAVGLVTDIVVHTDDRNRAVVSISGLQGGNEIRGYSAVHVNRLSDPQIRLQTLTGNLVVSIHKAAENRKPHKFQESGEGQFQKLTPEQQAKVIELRGQEKMTLAQAVFQVLVGE